LSAIHIARILKVSRTWLLTIEKQFPEGAPEDFKAADRIELIEPLEGKVSTRPMQGQ
jgi:hypothetical protein